MARATRVAALWLAGVLAIAFVAIGAAAPAPAPELLGNGDSVKVTVFQNPDLATEARISERGSITFPLIGEVVISGLTPDGAAARIADRLVRGKFVINPQVSLTVQQVRSRQVSVLGEVGKPGRYPLDDVSNSLTDVLARAGGISGEGDDSVVVVRTQNGKETRTAIDVPEMYRTGDMSHDMRLENGDVVYVKRAPQFYLYGEVQRAGAYRLQPQMTVMQAISVGGGVTPRGTLRGLQVQRRTADGQVRTVGVRPTDAVHADDVIVVRERLF
ncbi:MAG TPA: polysaccharide export protein EpsE [Steroidobacteraceae bacterium]|nr:polysaccharide export protein EpsE [Steroidobacteraceae bacterium]